MEVEEPRRLERVGAAADVFIRANDASVSSRSCGGAEALMVAVIISTRFYYNLRRDRA